MHLKFRFRVFLFLLLLLALLLASQVAINVFVEWLTCRTHPGESMWVGLEETAHILGLSLLLLCAASHQPGLGRGLDQASCSSRKATSCDLFSAPTLVAASWPFLNSISVGMPRMPNLAEMVRFSSTFTLAICSLSW